MVDTFLTGAICMGFFVASLFFVRFWRSTHDRLFIFFAAAFLMLMLERLIRFVMEMPPEWNPAIYSLRLIAFGVLLVGIADKNRRR